MPQVSVIIPVYNVEKYLNECLDSVINQTLTDIEIICVNDASPDNSSIILEEYAKKDPRINIITHERNLGLGPSRNTGVTNAMSPYIAFIDSDDYIALNFLEILYDLITTNNAEMAWCGMARISEEGLLLEPGAIPGRVWSIPEVLNCSQLFPGILSMCNKLFCRKHISKIEQLPIVMEDQPVIAEYFTYCNKIATSRESLYFYRKRSGTLSKPSDYLPQEWDYFFNSHKLFFNILRKKYPQPKVLRRQAILRHFAVLWRINDFSLLNTPSWKDQEKRILFYLNEDEMLLKASCPVMYRYLILLFKYNWNPKIKEGLLKAGMKLIRRSWVKCCSYWSIPFDIYKTLLWPKIKSLILIILIYTEITIFKIISKIYKLFNRKKIWLIGERRDTAQENGFYFYKYIKEEHPHEKSYYIIDKNNNQYNLVREYGNIIQYNSMKHKILFFGCNYYVTAHNDHCFPLSVFGNKSMGLPGSVKNVFIPHGVTYLDSSDYYGKRKTSISLFLCAAKDEYEYIKENFGYAENEVKYTGFSRFDGYHNFKTKKQIVLMPTWRWGIRYIPNSKTSVTDDYFINSGYYKKFQSFLNNQDLIQILTQYNYQLLFYPHYEVQYYLKHFSSSSDRVVIASKEQYIVQDLLKDSALLVTDTSSVSFDFAYMFKPLIYYFFDRDNFFKTHVRPGYFDHKTMGFGMLVEKEDELIDLIKHYLENGCRMEEQYRLRAQNFFPLHDNMNSKRIYYEIINS
ncbi:MAG: CDP-glycerol:glycerophosphate glycerophosphotransferase [Bacteroidales bacterium]|nr:CDP-glycerol:glycerophosphate glycerophosphotransferase [Bacteroidales bacterium]